jgi:hypothetical protein
MSLFKNVVIAVTAVVVSTSVAGAQDWANSDGSCYQKGSKEIHVGLLVPYIGLYGSAEYGFHEAISGGVNIGYDGHSDDILGFKESWSDVPVTVFAACHIQNIAALKDIIPLRDKLDIYIGLGIGFEFENYTYSFLSSDNYNHTDFIFREHIGVKYYFTSNMAVFLEDAGFEQGLGISFKF